MSLLNLDIHYYTEQQRDHISCGVDNASVLYHFYVFVLHHKISTYRHILLDHQTWETLTDRMNVPALGLRNFAFLGERSSNFISTLLEAPGIIRIPWGRFPCVLEIWRSAAQATAIIPCAQVSSRCRMILSNIHRSIMLLRATGYPAEWK